MNPMESNGGVNGDQSALWNGAAGHGWVQAQEVLDTMFEPLQQRLVDAVATADARAVLDVGCGTGGTTLAMARASGQARRCVGVDLSAPMIALAQARAAREESSARFLCADAQVHPFEPAAFDAIVSRFGVMFFGDPVRAFQNLRRAARPGATLCCQVWRSAAENPFMTAAEQAAAPWLPSLQPRTGAGPGQFAFAQRARAAQVLAAAHWSAVEVRPLDVTCRFPAAALDHYLRWVGPVARELQTIDEATRTSVLEAVHAAFERYRHAEEVRFDVAGWEVTARAAT